uniref:Uncharacterized protein n=1 Tax=viral metagenome TaxID=1070528 RepID=A0A6C0IX81_9ZZZZ
MKTSQNRTSSRQKDPHPLRFLLRSGWMNCRKKRSDALFDRRLLYSTSPGSENGLEKSAASFLSVHQR